MVRANTRELDFRPSNNSYFIGRTPYDTISGEPDDPGSVEISQYEIDRATPIQERSCDSFKNKVEEDIYRVRKHLFKKNRETLLMGIDIE